MSAFAESAAAWEPLTPRGVAAFARTRLSRLLLVQFVIASLAASALVWFLSNSCFTVVRAAIRNLPAAGVIRSGWLEWPDKQPQLLAEGRFLAFSVDPGHSGQLRSLADVQVEFGRENLRVTSLFGYAEWPYPADYTIAFNRIDLEPLWGAWEPEWLAIALLALVGALLLTWALLATLYFLPAWLVGHLANRDLRRRDSWKLAGAALLPGALLFTVAIVLFNWGVLDLIQLCFLFAAHLALGWVYLFLSPLFLPRRNAAPPRDNPFSSSPTGRPGQGNDSAAARDNPFAARPNPPE
ncbi:MAG TPA: hypothetical protein VMB80_02815 [Candidatus Acidoferrum sp.]|nr:hypothetical protein [Candidatus Acidoferrum sp.]